METITSETKITLLKDGVQRVRFDVFNNKQNHREDGFTKIDTVCLFGIIESKEDLFKLIERLKSVALTFD
jgi:hypothetical protein